MAEAPGGTAQPVAQAEPAAETAEGVPAWMRVDLDSLGLQLWFGATHDIGIPLATDIYVADFAGVPFAEFDVGPALSFGPVALTPMVGIGFDFGQRKAVSLIAPQLFTIVDLDKLYFESWIQAFLNSPFTSGADNNLYTRDFVLYKAFENLAIGPHIEATIALNNDRDALASLQVGGATMVGYGENNTLLLALGYETVEDARAYATGVDATGNPILADRGLVGRFTFVRSF
jgi:hypothetical protein